MKTTSNQNFSSIGHCLLELLPPKLAQLGSESKIRSYFFWVKSAAEKTQKLKLGIQKV